MAYEEVNPTAWEYSGDGDFIEGILVQVQKDVGENKSKLYSLETSEGIKNVWGSAILDSRMSLISIGSTLKITYKGLAEAKGGKNPAKMFRVEVDRE